MAKSCSAPDGAPEAQHSCSSSRLPQFRREMAQLQENINGIIATFYMYARSDGNCSPLSREELRQLFEQEFGDAIENPQDPQTIKQVLCFLDDDSNCRVDFSELLGLVFCVAKACYKPLQAPEDGQEVTSQEKASGEQPSEPFTARHSQQVPEQDVDNQVEDTETQDPDNYQTQTTETSKQDQDTHKTQESETPEQDGDTHQTQEGETPEQDEDAHQTQEAEPPGQDYNTYQSQEGETLKQDQATHQTEGETTKQDKDTHQDDGTEVPERDPKRSDNLDTATPVQDRNTHQAEDTNQDPKFHQAQETEAPEQGSNLPQSPKTESAEQDPDYHQHPEAKVLEEEHDGPESPSCPAQRQHDTHHQNQPAIEQRLLESLYQWPPQQ
ncbi:cornulin-like isoform X1 [Melopsittacus undulatus]|uniref:Uncharacterized protein n=2 Tax=Melopsittacus undulatus TaxID=13146 RepID=A0A8C6NCW6_MELUD|nr:cornulin-like isoform X1 [Melopsittacus undulatus]